MLWTGLMVFGVALLLELVWAGWTLAIAKSQPLAAALTSVACVYLGTFLVRTWLDDPSVIHWTAAGHGLGSYALLWWARRRLKKANKDGCAPT